MQYSLKCPRFHASSVRFLPPAGDVSLPPGSFHLQEFVPSSRQVSSISRRFIPSPVRSHPLTSRGFIPSPPSGPFQSQRDLSLHPDISTSSCVPFLRGVDRFHTPVVVHPGDELKMNCEFSSLDRDHTTLGGEGSYDEMCYGILNFYPANSIGNIGSCIQWKDLDFCTFFGGDCKYGDMMNSSNPDTADLIKQVWAENTDRDSCLLLRLLIFLLFLLPLLLLLLLLLVGLLHFLFLLVYFFFFFFLLLIFFLLPPLSASFSFSSSSGCCSPPLLSSPPPLLLPRLIFFPPPPLLPFLLLSPPLLLRLPPPPSHPQLSLSLPPPAVRYREDPLR